MCGFLVYQSKGNNFFIQKRGQDLTNKGEYRGFTFVHNLLSITGDFTPQPFEADLPADATHQALQAGGIVCLYNGEIYNHRYVKSDGENLIHLYQQYGVDFPKHLDGEWAIALYDFNKGLAVFATDLFATKPIWRNCLECASYESGVGGHKIAANTIEIVYFEGYEDRQEIHKWDLAQHKDNYDDWIKAFEAAVAKRATNGCFIGLSSGYDSGAIACELLKQNVDFKAYAIKAREDETILKVRLELIPNHQYFDSPEDFKKEKDWLKNNVEKFRYR